MDVVSVALRGSLASARGTYRTCKRSLLETIYVAKEFFFMQYDFVVAMVCCKRRDTRLLNAHPYVPMFSQVDLEPRRGVEYDFTQLQHGVSDRKRD